MIRSKKKDEIAYEFDKIYNAWKFNWDPYVLEALFIDKYHRTHEEYMNTPYSVIEILLLKRSSEAKMQKKQQTLTIRKK